MFSMSLRGVRAHARRFVSTAVAIVLGVGFLVAVLVMANSSKAAFDDLFGAGAAGTDTVVRADSVVDLGFGDERREPVSTDLVATIRAVPGVADVAVDRSGYAKIVGPNGKVVGSALSAPEAQQWIDAPELNPWKLSSGRAPVGPNEVVVNLAAATDADLRLGDVTTIYSPEPFEATVVGFARYGTADSMGPITTTLFSEAAALQHLGGVSPATADNLLIAAVDGVSEAQLTAAVAKVLPSGVEAITGTAWSDETKTAGDDIMGLVTPMMLTFAIISLLVAAFSIHNTFAIVSAQRTRDAALLRAIGASRRQIVGSSLMEAIIVGIVGSAIGVAVGIGLGSLLMRGMAMIGGIDASMLLITPSSILAGVIVGVGVTALASLQPALKASRIAPVEALRSTLNERVELGSVRFALGAVVLAGATAAAIPVIFGDAREALAGLSAGLLLIGVIVWAPYVSRVMVAALAVPIAAVKGLSGVMATRNTVRNPRRTAATATALVIGVSIVALATVYASSMKRSLTEVVEDRILGDVVVMASDMNGGFAPSFVDEFSHLDDVATVSGVGGIPAVVDGKATSLTYTESSLVATSFDIGVVAGDPADVVGSSIGVSRAYAEQHHVGLGDTVAVSYVDGTSADLPIKVIYTDEMLAGQAFIDTAAARQVEPTTEPFVLIAGAVDGVSAKQLAADGTTIADAWPGTTVETRAEFAHSQASMLDQLLAVIYVLLALSVVIALMGIANTISLSTFERRREIGLLRAVGQQRRQVRSMIRTEAILVSLLGTLLGLTVGVVGATLLTLAGDESIDTVQIPWPNLAIIAVIGAVAGVLAAARPARRAARTEVLDALAM